MAHEPDLDMFHQDIIKDLEDSFMKLNKLYEVPVTPKMHIIFWKCETLLKKSV